MQTRYGPKLRDKIFGKDHYFNYKYFNFLARNPVIGPQTTAAPPVAEDELCK